MDKKPLVVSGQGDLEQLQPGDCLANVVTPAEHNRLRHKFRTLLLLMIEEGFEIPEELLQEFNIT